VSLSGPAAWGVDAAYRDAFDRSREVAPGTQRAVLEAMGASPGETPPPSPVVIGRRGGTLPRMGRLLLEDGTDLGTVDRLPPDLPFGYHRLHSDADERLLIVGPGRCQLPAGLRTWGWALQLYALRSSGSWGIGDLADLRQLAGWSRDRGAEVLLINPLHAPNPVLPPEPSPYFPSTRRFLNPLYLAVEEVPGAERVDLGAQSAAARSLNAGRLIDRDRVARAKLEALRRIWAEGRVDERFERFRAEQGAALREWASFAVLTEQFGAGWSRWPAELRRPGPAVDRFAAAHAGQVAFHEWLQWLLDLQLAAASAQMPLLQDVPVGVDPEGFDAWTWQEQLALGTRVGAPPDRFNSAGQDWGFPPFIPHRLRSAHYEPLIQTLRACLRHAGGLRIDHVLGLFRLWWVPAGASSPVDGAYVRYPADELLEIVALESERAGAMVIGEDLGTVEKGVRRQLARRRILSSRVVWFEERAPRAYPKLALASITTHDLPTIAGAWNGSDIQDQEKAGGSPSRREAARIVERLARFAGVRADAPLDEAIVAAHRSLGATPSMLVTATLDDALAVAERPNMPGTTDTWPNWSIALPKPLEEIRDHPLVMRVATALDEGRRSSP
jgi:4-alpha-glucanotransferase